MSTSSSLHTSHPVEHFKGTRVVDLFCGIGGLTHGLVLEGLEVVAGVDNDVTAKFAFESNNDARFIRRDVARLSANELADLYGNAAYKILVGCAPCQPFSTLNRNNSTEAEIRRKWYPLYRFMRLVQDVHPDVISMENVPDLKKHAVFDELLQRLDKLKYHVFHRIVDASRYGVPQRRRRLVLLASRLGPIEMVPETHAKHQLITVRKAIYGLPSLSDGEASPIDPLHRASKLSERNRKRIKATPPDGGDARDWPDHLLPDCYKKKSGESYMVSVYGRMRWDEPSPTITTQFTTLGTGRFGHPTQHRAISLKEAALLQSFPSDYKFFKGTSAPVREMSRHIGNAVPVLLGRAIGASIKLHLKQFLTPA